MVYQHRVKYHSTLKAKQMLINAETQINFEDNMLGKVSQ